MTMKPRDIALHAAPPVQDETYEANTKWCDDLKWEDLGELLPMGVRNRLAKANRALFASNLIAQMLVEDARGKDDASDDARVTYKGLGACQVEALRLAMIELGSRAEECLAEVRDNDDDCCGKMEEA